MQNFKNSANILGFIVRWKDDSDQWFARLGGSISHQQSSFTKQVYHPKGAIYLILA
jgi:hypothetical protein